MSKQTINTSTATDTLATGFDKVNSNFTEVYASIIQTGFIVDYVGTNPPDGWLVCNGQSIGNAGSSAGARANADTRALFDLIWNNWDNAQASVSGGRGVSSAADFAANKTLDLPDFRGRVSVMFMGGVFTNLGLTIGEETHILDYSELPDLTHSHAYTFPSATTSPASSGGDFSAVTFGESGSTSSDGFGTGGVAHNNIQPSLVINKIIKL